MAETVITTIQHVDLEPNTAQPGQNVYNFTVEIRGVTNDPEAANMTKWNPFCLLILTKIYPPQFPTPLPPMVSPVEFSEGSIELDAALVWKFRASTSFYIE